MQDESSKNPLVRLFGALPAGVSKEKRRLIRADMKAIGKLEHYRQRVQREDWKPGDTHIACAAVLMTHLGLSLEFFTAPKEASRLAEITRIVDTYKPLTR